MGEIYSKPEEGEAVSNQNAPHEQGDTLPANYSYINGSHPSAASQPHSSQRATPGRIGATGSGSTNLPTQATRPNNINGGQPSATISSGNTLHSADYSSRFYLSRNSNTLQDSREPPRRETMTSQPHSIGHQHLSVATTLGGPSQISSTHIGLSPNNTPTTISASNIAPRPLPSHISLPPGYGSTLPPSVLRRPQLINEQQPPSMSHPQLHHSQQQSSNQGKRPRLTSGGGAAVHGMYPNDVDEQQFGHPIASSVSGAAAAASAYLNSASLRFDRLPNALPTVSSPKLNQIPTNASYHAAMSGIARVINSSMNPEHLVAGPSGYQPQVEAISPAPEDVRLDSNLIKEKEEISTKLVQVEKEITHHEESKRRLLQRQEQLMERITHRQAAHERGSDVASAPHGPSRAVNTAAGSSHGGEGTVSSEEPDDLLLKPKGYSNPIQDVLNENRQKTKEMHENLLRLCGLLPSQRAPGVSMNNQGPFPDGLSPLDAPLYRQPNDLDSLQEEIRYYNEEFKPRLVHYIRKRRLAERARLLKLSEQYDAQAKIWCKKVDKVNNSSKRRQKEARMREQFERVFPEIKKNREEREKSILAAEELAAAAELATGSVGSGTTSNNISSSHPPPSSCAHILPHSGEERYSTRGTINSNNNANSTGSSADDEIIPYDPVKERQRLREQAAEPPITIPLWDRKYDIVLCKGTVRDPKAQHRQDLDTFSYWSPDEDIIFRRCYVQFTKNFHQYIPYLPRKRVQDMVQYYYLTKGRAQYKNLLKKQNRRRGRGGLPLSIPSASVTGVTAYQCGVSLSSTHSRISTLGAVNVEQADREGPLNAIDTATVEVDMSKKEFAPAESSCAPEEVAVAHVKPLTPLAIFNPMHEEVSSAEEEEERLSSTNVLEKIASMNREAVPVDIGMLNPIFGDKAGGSVLGDETRTRTDPATPHSGEQSTCIKDIIHMVIDRTLNRSWKDNPTLEEKAEEERASSTTSSGRPTLSTTRPDVVRAPTPTAPHQPSAHYPIPQSLPSHPLHRYQPLPNPLTGEASTGLSLSPGNVNAIAAASLSKANAQGLNLLHSHAQLPSTVVPNVVPSAAAHFYRTHPFMSHHQQALLQQHIANSAAHPPGCMPLPGGNSLGHSLQGIPSPSTSGEVASGNSMPIGMMPSAHHLAMRQNFADSLNMSASQTAIVYPHAIPAGLSAVPLPSFLPVSGAASSGPLPRPPLSRLSAPFILPTNAPNSSLPSPGNANNLPGYPHSIHSIASSLSNNLGTSGGVMPSSSLNTSSVERPSSGTTQVQENSNKAILDCDFLTAQEIVSPVLSVASTSNNHAPSSYPNKITLSKPPSILGREDQRHNSIPPNVPTSSLKLGSGSSNGMSAAATGAVNLSTDRNVSQNRAGAINPSDLPSVKSLRGMAAGRNSPHHAAACDIQPPDADPEVDTSHTRHFSSEAHRFYMEQMGSMPFRTRSDSQRTRTSSEASQCVKAAELIRRKISQLQAESQVEPEPEQHAPIQQPMEVTRNKPSPHNKEDMPPPMANFSVGRFRMGGGLDRSGGTTSTSIMEPGPPPTLSPSTVEADSPRRQNIAISGPEAFRKRGYTDSGLNLRSPSTMPEPQPSRANEPITMNSSSHQLPGNQTGPPRGAKGSGAPPRTMSSTSTTAALVMAAAFADSDKSPPSDASMESQNPFGMTTASIISAMIDKHITDGESTNADSKSSSTQEERTDNSLPERAAVPGSRDMMKKPVHSVGGAAFTRKGEAESTLSHTIGYQIEKYIEQEANNSPPSAPSEHASHMSTTLCSPFPKRRLLNALYEASCREEAAANDGRPVSSTTSYPPAVAYKSNFHKTTSSKKEGNSNTPSAYATQSPTSRGHSGAYSAEDASSGNHAMEAASRSEMASSAFLPKSPKQASPRASASPLVVTSTSPVRGDYSKKSNSSPQTSKSDVNQAPSQLSPQSPIVNSNTNISSSIMIPTPSPPTPRESHMPPKKRALIPPPLPSPVALSSGGSSPFREGDLQIDIESTASQDEGQDSFLTHMSD